MKETLEDDFNQNQREGKPATPLEDDMMKSHDEDASGPRAYRESCKFDVIRFGTDRGERILSQWK